MNGYFNILPEGFEEILKGEKIDGMWVRSLVEAMTDKIYQQALADRKIWKGEGKDTRWKFKTDDGKLVAKTTEDAIKKAYAEYLNEKAKRGNSNVTYAELFSKWLDYKHEVVGTEKGQLSPSTYKRYLNDYKKYIQGTKLDKTELGSIMPIDIESFFKGMVKSHTVNRRCFNNVAGYVKATFEFAYKSGFLSNNPFTLADLKRIRCFCVEAVKDDSDRTLTTEEMQMLLVAVHNAEEKDELYMPNYAIELSMLTGMRVGEIAALKWECVKPDGIHIDYSEHRLDYEGKPSEIIIGEPKNGKHRVFPMTAEAESLFKKIKAVQKKNGIKSEFVFADKDGRYTERKIGLAMARRCRNAKIPEKSVHDVRRTVSSNLRTKLPVATVSNMLGHLDTTNEAFYNYDTLTMDYKKEVLSEVWGEIYGKGEKRTA